MFNNIIYFYTIIISYYFYFKLEILPLLMMLLTGVDYHAATINFVIIITILTTINIIIKRSVTIA